MAGTHYKGVGLRVCGEDAGGDSGADVLQGGRGEDGGGEVLQGRRLRVRREDGGGDVLQGGGGEDGGGEVLQGSRLRVGGEDGGEDVGRTETEARRARVAPGREGRGRPGAGQARGGAGRGRGRGALSPGAEWRRSHDELRGRQMMMTSAE